MKEVLRPISMVLIALGIMWITFNKIMIGEEFNMTNSLIFTILAIGLLVYSYWGINVKK